MSRVHSTDEIVTQFFLNTCLLHPPARIYVVQAAASCVILASQRLEDAEANNIPLTTGSVAEFYIEPMLPHVGDVDVMYHRSDELAIPRAVSYTHLTLPTNREV